MECITINRILCIQFYKISFVISCIIVSNVILIKICSSIFNFYSAPYYFLSYFHYFSVPNYLVGTHLHILLFLYLNCEMVLKMVPFINVKTIFNSLKSICIDFRKKVPSSSLTVCIQSIDQNRNLPKIIIRYYSIY